MGGFTLQGPNYKFHSVRCQTGDRCRCAGFKSDISAEVETLLLNQDNKTLPLNQLPVELVSALFRSHWGDSMQYKVKPNGEEKVSEALSAFGVGLLGGDGAKAIVNGVSGWDAMFAPLSSLHSLHGFESDKTGSNTQ